MEVYKLARHNNSKTGKYVIITIELLSVTDTKDFTEKPALFKGKLVNDFYLSYLINAGKIKKITSLDESQEFESARLGSDGAVLQTGKYFKISNYDYSKPQPTDSYGLKVYKYKNAVLNESGYVSPSMTGTQYLFRENGKILEKNYFKRGKLVIKHKYFDNLFNSLESVSQHTDSGILTGRFDYDERENLVSQTVFNSDGTVFSHKNYQPDGTVTSSLAVTSRQKRPAE